LGFSVPALSSSDEDINNLVNVPFRVLKVAIKCGKCYVSSEAVVTASFRPVYWNSLSFLKHVADVSEGVEMKLITRLSVPGECLEIVLCDAPTLVIRLAEF